MIPGILAGAGLLLWPALLNGYPLVFIDSGAYLAQTIIPRMAWDKSWVYGPLIHLGHWHITLWGAVVLQAMVLSWLLWLAQRVVLGKGPAWRHAALMAAMALTSLPWFASMLMPDVFAGVAVLALWLLGFCRADLSRAEVAALVLLATLAIAMHLSHLPIAVAMLGLALLWRRAAIAAIPLTLAVLVLLVGNGIGHGRFALSPHGATFALARLQADGPATGLLRARCPAAGWYLCAFIDRLPMDSDTFLWDPASPLSLDSSGRARPMGTVLISAEAGEIVRATLLTYPREVIGHALRNTAMQLIRFRVGDMLGPDHLDASARMMIEAGFPGAELARFDTALQIQGQLEVPLRALHLPMVILAALAGMVLAWGLRREPAGTLLACILVGLLANAAATGALSAPFDRYQARIIWLLPFAVALAGLRMTREMNRL